MNRKTRKKNNPKRGENPQQKLLNLYSTKVKELEAITDPTIAEINRLKCLKREYKSFLQGLNRRDKKKLVFPK